MQHKRIESIVHDEQRMIDRSGPDGTQIARPSSLAAYLSLLPLRQSAGELIPACSSQMPEHSGHIRCRILDVRWHRSHCSSMDLGHRNTTGSWTDKPGTRSRKA